MTTVAKPVPVVTTYLELPDRAAFRPWWTTDPDVTVVESHIPFPAFYRFLYRAVGETYHWTMRLDWSDEQLLDYLSRPSVTLLVMYVKGTPAGYIELNAESEEPDVEVAYFGLAPMFHGRGLGKHLLSVGVQRAFDDGARRVWVHTCTLDGRYALANYQARGFRPYKTTTETVVIPVEG
jgi:ribosomal protein S18 acetylase RimI-like enzyme